MTYTWGVQTCTGAPKLADELNRIESLGWEVYSVVSAGHETRSFGDPRVEHKMVDGAAMATTTQDMAMTPCFAIVARIKVVTT